MNILQPLFVIGLSLACSTPGMAQGDTPRIGDTHIISRDGNRTFKGSHRIFNRMSEGLVEVIYCNRSYWVRYATVAWTQLEVKRGYELRVEFNRGKGWRPICAHPDAQVSLADLGITEDPRLIIQEDGPVEDRSKRFAAIRKSFGTEGNRTDKSSYHDTE